MKPSYSKQSVRMLAALKSGRIIPAPELSQIGSGNPQGWCASFTKRISELRSQGFNVVKVKDEHIDGQRHTAYQLQQDSFRLTS